LGAVFPLSVLLTTWLDYLKAASYTPTKFTQLLTALWTYATLYWDDVGGETWL